MAGGARGLNRNAYALRGVRGKRVEVDHVYEVCASRPVDCRDGVFVRFARDDDLKRFEDAHDSR